VFDWLSFFDFLNNREKAILFWTIAMVAFSVFKSDGLGGSFLSVLRALASPKLLVLFGSAATYCAALLFVANYLGLWHTTGIKATVYWFFGTGVVLVGSATAARPGLPITLRPLLRRALKLTILVEFLVNLYVFPFVAELVVVLLASLFVMLQVVDQYNPTDPLVTRFINWMLGAIGFGLLAYVAVKAISDLGGFLTREHAEDFLVAPALSIALVPFLYGVAWVSRREQENLRKRFRSLSSSPA
jgi:hypothetical protein